MPCPKPRDQAIRTNPASRRLACCLALLSGLALSTSAQADIYGRMEEDGSLHLSDYSQDKRDTLLIAEGKAARAGGASRTDPPATYVPLVAEAARRHEVDAALIHAVIMAESSYNPRAVSHKGAAGLMQLMPGTAQRLGVVDIYDPGQNIQGGARYLKELLSRFDNDLPLTLAAYNAGEDAVARYNNRIPPFRETRGYVDRVLKFYRKFSRVPP